MLYKPLIFFAILLLLSCETPAFDKDKRQITAKNEIRKKLSTVHSFDILNFKEDTISYWKDSTFKNPIRYTLNFVYNDSIETVQSKTGVVIFTPDGKSIISSEIIEAN